MTSRQSVLNQINEKRQRQLHATSARYAKLPEHVRAAIAEGAGVPNEVLSQLTAEERRRLKTSAKSLATKVAAARGLLVKADFSE